MTIIQIQSQYGWQDAEPTCAHEYILPAVLKEIQKLFQGKSARILDMGCGNGYVAAQIAPMGHSVVAIDGCVPPFTHGVSGVSHLLHMVFRLVQCGS